MDYFDLKKKALLEGRFFFKKIVFVYLLIVNKYNTKKKEKWLPLDQRRVELLNG